VTDIEHNNARRRATPRARASIERHVRALRACTTCPDMQRPAVTGRPVCSPVLLVGQAPGSKEPELGRPFAWTAGKTLFRWFQEHVGIDEERFRSRVYMAAVCRCFPGRRPRGGDRVPSSEEIENCAHWLEAEIRILRPQLVVPVGRLAITQFMPYRKLEQLIGERYRCSRAGQAFDAIPLPHPSGASPWPRVEPGKTLLRRALAKVRAHPAMQDAAARR